MANETTSTSISEVIYSEHIPGFLADFRYGPDLSGVIPWVESVPKGGGTDFKFPRANEITVPAGTKTEATGAFTNVEFTTAEAVAVSGVVGLTLDVSREAGYDNRAGIPRTALAEALKSMRRRLNQDMFAAAVGGTGAGTDTTPMSVEYLASALAAFETQNPEASQIAIVLHSGTQWTELLADLATSTATLLQGAGGSSIMSGVPGFKGMFMNAALFTSPHIAEATDMQHGIITEIGRGRSGLGVAVWQGTRVELEPQGGRYSDQWHVHARYGCVRTGMPLHVVRSQD